MTDLKRALDVIGAGMGLVIVAPVLVLAALAIRLTSPGPVLYRARRAGAGGRPFTMYKLRTMHATAVRGSPITGAADPRVFPVGRLLRGTKIDELPQLVNVLRGQMSLVGPRPEDPELVARHYAPLHRETLAVRPGLTSPGTLYYDTQGDRLLAGDDPEARYVESLLPVKLALDVAYVRRASVAYDLILIWRTLVVIAGRLAGRRTFPDPPELRLALPLVVRARAVPGRTSEPSVAAPVSPSDPPRPVAAEGAR
jgi:lipopolysaccharide/colanic/teichoic acid biosynthesis glycosyltransferase